MEVGEYVMARKRSPKRDEAFELWKDSNGEMLLKDIAAQLGLKDSQIRKWKSEDKWEEKIKKKKGAPLGNKNAVGNIGGGAPKGNKNALGHGAPRGNQNGKGHGPPKGNSNAVKTGLYQNFFQDVFDEDELEFLENIDPEPSLHAKELVKILTLREKAILKRIKSVKEGLTSTQKLEFRRRRKVKEKIEVEDPLKGGYRTVNREDYKMVLEEEHSIEESPIETLLKLEEALTKVQKEKLKAIKTLHDITYKFEHDKLMNEKKAAIMEEKWAKEKGSSDDQQKQSEDWVAGLQNVFEKRKAKRREL